MPAHVTEAQWTRAYINDLPDSAFLYIEPGGEKDEDGKTVPRSLRHFPVKDHNGQIDLPHLRNALARIRQSKLPAEAAAAALKQARALAKEVGIEVSDDTEAVTAAPSASTIREVIARRATGFDGWIVGPVVQEGATEPSGYAWDVVIIEAGLSRNRNLYERAVLEAAVPKYEGARLFMDHEEQPRRFGRSTRDLAGFLKDVRPALVASEAEGTARFAIAATAWITKRWVREELLDAWRAGKPDLYGLSHDVRATSQIIALPDGPAVKVDAIERVESVDFVTNPAAGGRLLRLVAADDGPASTLEEDGRMLQKLLAQLRALNRPDLIAGLGAQPTEDQVIEAITKALAEAPARSDASPPPAAPAPAPKGASPPAAAAVSDADWADIREAKRTIAELRVERDLQDCALPERLKERLRSRFRARMDAGQIPSQADITAAIKEAVEDYGALAEAGVVLPHVPSVQVVKDRADKIREALDHFFDPTKPPRSFRELYVDITGDTRITGRLSEATRLRESLNTTSFDQVLGDSITRRMLQYYGAPEFTSWRAIASVTSVNDFRTQRRVRFGGYGNLPVVNQGQAYTALTSPTDEEATYAPAKRGGTESVTLEMIANDDVGAIRQIPQRLGRAAAQTLYEFVWDFLATNAIIFDGVALAAAGHNNLVTSALSASNLGQLRLNMKKQTDPSSGKRLGIVPRYLIVPSDLEDLAIQLTQSPKMLPDSSLATTAEPAAINVIRDVYRLQPQVVHYWTDANNYWLAASPDQVPMIEVGFLNGQQEPEIFVQDLPTVGSMFNNDQLTWKIRHIYGAAVLDYRGFAAGIVA